MLSGLERALEMNFRKIRVVETVKLLLAVFVIFPNDHDAIWFKRRDLTSRRKDRDKRLCG
jgi:hypothetical protein